LKLVLLKIRERERERERGKGKTNGLSFNGTLDRLVRELAPILLLTSDSRSGFLLRVRSGESYHKR